MVPTSSLKLSAILTGPTASGKTAAALRFARERGDIEIINGDSLLFYTGLDIGTAKPTQEEREAVPHHLIDIIDPGVVFTAGDFFRATELKIAEIHGRGKRALIVGGSGFYLKTLVHGLWDAPPANPELRKELEKRSSPDLYESLYKIDEEAALRIGVNDRYRLVRAHEILQQSGLTPTQLETQQKAIPRDPRFALLWIDREPDDLNSRIEARTKEMLGAGLIAETEWLRTTYPQSRTLLAIGYAETVAYLDGRLPQGRKIRSGMDGLADEITLSTRQLVKKQRTWFRNQFKDTQTFLLDKEALQLQQRLTEIYS